MGHVRSGRCAALEIPWRPAPAWDPWYRQTTATSLADTPFLTLDLVSSQDQGSGGGAQDEPQMFRGDFQSCSVAPVFWVLRNQSTCNLKRSVLFLQQQDSRRKAVTKETCLSHVSGISDYVNGVIPTISDFI